MAAQVKSNVLIASEDNIIKTLKENTIGRNNDVYDFCLLLNCVNDSYSINLSSRVVFSLQPVFIATQVH